VTSQRILDNPIEDVLEIGDRVIGVMIESHINPGRQDLVPGKPLVYGQSITDGCIDWPSSIGVLERLADAVQARRRARANAA